VAIKEDKINADFVVEEAPTPFNRHDFIYQDKDDNDVTRLITHSFQVIVENFNIQQLLNMLCYMKGNILTPKINHHFVTLDNQYHELKNAFELEIKNETLLLNNRLYVGCFKVSSSRKSKGSKDLVPLYTIDGKPTELFASFITKQSKVKNLIKAIKDNTIVPITDYSRAQNIKEMESIHIAPSDGGHRTRAFDQIAREIKTKGLLQKNYNLQVHFLLPKSSSTSSDKVLEDFSTFSNHVMKLTKKGKGHSLWDALQTVFNLMMTTLEKENGETNYTGRIVSVTIKDKKDNDILKEVPALLYCKEPASIFAAFTQIFEPIIKALLQHDDLKEEWISYYGVSEANLYEPIQLLDCHQTLDKFTTFMGTDIYDAFKSANHSHTVKLKIQNINMPFQFIQVFHVILTAAISRNHFQSIQAYLQKMDATNLLSLSRLLTIVSTADDLVNNPSLFPKNAPNIRRVRKIYHSMLLFSILEGYATHGPFPDYPDHWCYKIAHTEHLHEDLTNYDSVYKEKAQTDLLPTDDILTQFKKKYFKNHDFSIVTKTDTKIKDWTCTTDIFFHYYAVYIKNLNSRPWFKGVNNITSMFTKHLSRQVKMKTSDFDLPPTIRLFNKKTNKYKRIPFSFKNVMSTMFESFPGKTDDDTLSSTCFWQLDNFYNLDLWFGLKKVEPELPDEETTTMPYTECNNIARFKKMCMEEYDLQSTKLSRKKDLAKNYFLLDQSTQGCFDWHNSRRFLKQLEDPSLKQRFTYRKIKDFEQFQMQTFIHRNMTTTTPGFQTTIETAYMVIDYATNTKQIPFKKAQKILNDLDTESYTVFQPYHNDNDSE
jgi:hypothetical protein